MDIEVSLKCDYHGCVVTSTELIAYFSIGDAVEVICSKCYIRGAGCSPCSGVACRGDHLVCLLG